MYSWSLRLVCLLAALAVMSAAGTGRSLAADYYVDALYGDDGNAGTGWTAAKATITAALALVTEPGGTVHVAAGYYFERLTVTVDSTVLLGGYPPGGGPRNPWALTDIYGSEGGATITVSNAADAVIDGFTVRGGSSINGGGVFCDVTTGAIVRNCTVRTNAATNLGGGVAVRNGYLTLDACIIENNSCTGPNGGGVAVINSNLTMTGCEVTSNLVTHASPGGGGLAIDGTSTATVSGCLVNLNTAATTLTTNSLSAYGGGVHVLGIAALTDNTFSGNTAHGTLAISSTAAYYRYAYGGALYCGASSQVTCAGNVFDGNRSYAEARNASTGATYGYSYGGAICCAANSQLTLSGDLIENNIADGYGAASGGRAYTYGGGLACQNSSRVTASGGVEFRGNLARSLATALSYSYGGGIYGTGAGAVLSFDGLIIMGNDMLTTPDNASLGEGVFFESCPVSLTNCIVAENDGDGIYLSITPAAAVVRNCTVAYNAGNGLKGHNTSTYASVSNCILWGNSDDLTQLAVTYCNVQEGAPGTGNINPPCNPMFAGGGDYHLLPQSCCIDRGTAVGLVPADIDGDVRPYPGTAPDIGADEVGASNPTPTPFATPPGGSTATPYPTPANDFYVDGLLGDDADNGLTWGAAKASITAAVRLAEAAGGGTVHVATGIYNENVAAVDNLQLLGGYPHGGGNRDAYGFPTLIDGGNFNSAVLISESENVEIDGFTIRNGRGGFGGGIYISRSQHVRIARNVITQNVGAETPNLQNITLGGGVYIYGTDITIENNNINNNRVEGASGLGGGIYVAGGHQIAIRNNTIQQNTAVMGGAGIHVAGGDAATLLDGNLIQANQTLNMTGITYSGGAGLRIESTGWVRAVNNTFAGNSATAPASTSGLAYGGAIFCAGDLELAGNVLTGNAASVNATVNYHAFGGAVFCAAGGDLASSDNLYLSNQATGYTYSFGGAVAVEANGRALFANDTFRGNTAASTVSRTYGGAVHCADLADVTFSFGTLFEQNTAVTAATYAYGGAVCVWGTNAAVVLDGVMMRQNVAQGQSAAYHQGHGLHVYQAPAMVQNSFFVRHAGNAVQINAASLTFRNNTVADNNGIGIRQTGTASPAVINCIVWGNTDDIDAVAVTYCNVQEGAAGEGNFVPPANPQFVGGGDYHILRTSPCVDRGSYLGNPDHDCDQENRPYGSTLPDVGADEVAAMNPTPTPTPSARQPPTATPAGTLTPTATAAPGSDFYADGIYGNDGNPGTSWAAAKKTVGAAAGLAAAAGGGTVHVAMGTYVENVALESRVRLWGGYPHGGGARRPDSFQTILDGGNIDAVLRLGSAADVEIDGFTLMNGRGGFGGAVNMSQARSIHITNNRITLNQCLNAPPDKNLALGGGVYIDGTDVTVADNAFISNSVNGTIGDGGAVYCAAGRQIVIRGNTFTGNTATHNGGAIYTAVTESEVVIDGNTFSANQALCAGTSGGGALCLGTGAKALVTGNTFTGNLASILNLVSGTCFGGAVLCSGQLTLSGNLFEGNIAQARFTASHGGNSSISAYGGAVYCASGGLVLSAGNEYRANSASAEHMNTYAGVATYGYAYGGAFYCANGGQITIDGDVVRENVAYSDADSTGYAYSYGGGLFAPAGGSITVNRGTKIWQNRCHSAGTQASYGYGGGINITGATATALFDGADIRGNTITAPNAAQGPGVYIDTCPAQFVNCFIVEQPGDGMYLKSVTSAMRVINCTIAANTSAGIRGASATADIHNCILWGNNDDLVNATATYSDIQGGDAGEGNLNPPCNPLFVGGGDYHILPQSCCVDRGTVVGVTSHDTDGEVRPYNGSLVDIGADEVAAFNPTPTPYSTPTGSETPTAAPTPANNFYVDQQNGSDANSGASWAAAKATIGAAVALARTAGDGRIHVAVGIYNERLTPGANSQLWGGYPPGGGVRDPVSQITIVDGGGRDSVVAIGGVANVEIDGFTIRNGRGGYGGGIVAVNANGLRISRNIIAGNTCQESPAMVNLALGGGLYLQGSRITVEDNEISGNSVTGNEGWGGGIYCVGGDGIVIRGNAVTANTTAAGGGGIAVAGPGSPVLIEDNLINGNSCTNAAAMATCGGGALRLLPGSAVIARGNMMDSNSVTVSGTTVNGFGGAIYNEGALTLEGNTLNGNSVAATATTGFYAYGGALFCASGSTAASSGNTYSSNQASAYIVYGGAVHCAGGSQAAFAGDDLIGNSAVSANYRVYGGAVACANNSTVLIGRGTLIGQNLGVAHNSYCYGGGVYIQGAAAAVTIDSAVIQGNSAQASSTTYAYGHGIYSEAAAAVIRNCIVAQNKWADSYGVGLYLSGGSPSVVNCTIADNRNYGIRWAGSGSPQVQNCIVWGHIDDLYGIAATYSNTMEGLAGTGNIIPPANPMFVSETDYHILPESPCVDRGLNTGAPADDIDGDGRPFNGLTVDIGADETSGANPTPVPSVTPASPTPVGSPTPVPGPGRYADQVRGSDSNDGMSWAAAKASITAALAVAPAGSVVHVARGAYYESLDVPTGVTILGGYPSGGGTRDPVLNTCTVHGGGTDTTVKMSNVENVALDGLKITGGYGVRGGGIYCYGSEHVILSNLVVEGNTAASRQTSNYGGGLYVAECYDVWIQGCTVRQNTATGSVIAAGAGGYFDATSRVLIAGSTFSDNQAYLSGGALQFMNSGSDIVLAGNTFASNQAYFSTYRAEAGGAIFQGAGVSLTIAGNTFTGNQAYGTAAGTPNTVTGGALYLLGAADISGNLFQANEARHSFTSGYSATTYTYAYGGAVYCGGGSVVTSSGNSYAQNRAHAEFANTTAGYTTYTFSYGGAVFIDANAQFSASDEDYFQNVSYSRGLNASYAYSYAGAIHCAATTQIVLGPGLRLDQNTAQSAAVTQGHAYGGSVFADTATSLLIDGNRISGNDAVAAPATSQHGDGLYINGSVATALTNCFITGNLGHGLYVYSAGANVKISNNTLANNTTHGIYRGGGTLAVTNCILWNNGDDLYVTNSTYSCVQDGDAGTGNIALNPQFMNADFHIQGASPCQDAALPQAGIPSAEFDIDGDARPQGAQFDMGADEFTAAPRIDLTVKLDGYYSGGSQAPATVDLELRSGAGPATAATVVASLNGVAVDADGNTGPVDLPNWPPSSSYYLVVSHLNHLTVITAEPVALALNETAVIDLADNGSPDFVECYGTAALKTEGDGALSLRGGNGNGDRYINASGDFVIWHAANGSVPGSGNWDERADFNGNEAVNSADFSVWLAQNGRSTWAPNAAKAGRADWAADWAKQAGPLRLKVVDDPGSERPWIEVEVVYDAPAGGRALAVDAALAFDPKVFRQPSLVSDPFAAGTTDFSLGAAGPAGSAGYHYSRGALPGQEGIRVRPGENAVYRLRFPLKQPRLPGKLPIGFVPGFAGVASAPQAPGAVRADGAEPPAAVVPAGR